MADVLLCMDPEKDGRVCVCVCGGGQDSEKDGRVCVGDVCGEDSVIYVIWTKHQILYRTIEKDFFATFQNI